MHSNHRLHVLRMALSGAILFSLNACSFDRVENARQDLLNHSQQDGFEPDIFHTSQFPVFSLSKKRNSPQLRIYIEGDGLAWFDTNIVSEDPTPSHPIGFELAAADRSKCDVLYLARPCQFVRNDRCHDFYWTSGRFHPEIIRTYVEIIDRLITASKYKDVTLLGYSGGAAIALLTAAHRKDIREIITFAGTLDSDAWTHLHQYTPLAGSLNPVHFNQQLKLIPQTHFVGLDDETMPLDIARSYLQPFTANHKIQLVKTPLNHYEGWGAYWQMHPLNPDPHNKRR